MFGLLTSPIPVALKGELLNLLASLSLNPLIAINMWQLLESSQILSTTFTSSTSSSSYSSSRNDIKIELEEVEAREESYSMLRGFLKLLRNLLTITHTPPDTLGLGIRPKLSPLGFQPYLHFLVNHVYLKCLYRTYKNSHEKWLVCSELLHILFSLVANYEINPLDFQQQQQQTTSASVEFNAFKSPISNSAGYRLIYDLIHDGPIVKMLFVMLNESLAHLLEYNGGGNGVKEEEEMQKPVEATALMCLRLIAVVLEKQRLFVEQMRAANLSTENSGLEKLIVSINPKTNRAEFLMAILR